MCGMGAVWIRSRLTRGKSSWERASTLVRRMRRACCVSRRRKVRCGAQEGMISYGSAWADASTTPWRYYKHACHEGGISGPFIGNRPARIKSGGQIRQQVGHLMDLMPTFVDVAGAKKYPTEHAGQKIDPPEGKSIVGSFDGGAIGHDTLAWEHGKCGHSGGRLEAGSAWESGTVGAIQHCGRSDRA